MDVLIWILGKFLGAALLLGAIGLAWQAIRLGFLLGNSSTTRFTIQIGNNKNPGKPKEQTNDHSKAEKKYPGIKEPKKHVVKKPKVEKVRPKWIQFLFYETPSSLMAKRKERKKAARLLKEHYEALNK